ncbi:uncharacterized protein LOC129590513 [Paramacrobiotus metropolitanus]|uniref:uncharacterized protein LOC129590513 n=1 Tax=Paramacrobiotus metropolitanus TaxID=2943436 RepID=UPI0024461EB1|nr:uncharacterized protein LOC129590513 [Paramacrobiotus metropolitanus]
MVALVILAFLLCFSVNSGYAAILSTNDPRYTLWPVLFNTDPYVRVPVYVEKARYDLQTQLNINASLLALNTDLTGCLQFVQVPSPTNVGRDFIYVSPVSSTGAAQQTCGTVPGHLAGSNPGGQKMYILPGTGPGQCGGSVRQIMGRFANAIGLRNEYQRNDRPITVTTGNIATSLANIGASMYAAYTANVTVYPQNTAYDYNSITQITPQTNANPGVSMFTNPGGQASPTLNRLSNIDCNAIKWRYNCNSNVVCADPYGQQTPANNNNNNIPPNNGQQTNPQQQPSGPVDPTDQF